MRISSYNAFQTSVSNLQKRQQDLATVQSQMTSGLRVSQPGDDPVAAAQVVRSLAAQSRVDAQTTALNASQSDMQLSESALGNASTLLQQARALVVQAGNGSYTDSDRASLAQQLQGLRSDLLAQANQTDGNGRYLFGGQGSDSPPFVDGQLSVNAATGAVSSVSYVGTAGQQQAVSSQAMPLTVDGNAAWMQTANPAAPGTTISVFAALDQTIASLNTPNQSSSAIATTVSQGLASIDAVSNTLSSARSAAGQALNNATTVGSQLSQAKLAAQTTQSNAQDLDMTAAISDFQNKQTGYDAALKTYSLVQQMSLFQYLK